MRHLKLEKGCSCRHCKARTAAQRLAALLLCHFVLAEAELQHSVAETVAPAHRPGGAACVMRPNGCGSIARCEPRRQL